MVAVRSWLGVLILASLSVAQQAAPAPQPQRTNLPTSKVLIEPVPGAPQATNTLPLNIALSPDGRYAAVLNNGYGSTESNYAQSIAILDLTANKLTDFPDARFDHHAHQSYFFGLAFSPDGSRLYASVGSITDPTATQAGDLGNGLATYRLADGALTPDGFLPIPPRALQGKRLAHSLQENSKEAAPPFPAGIAVSGDGKLLVGNNLSDDAVLMDASGKILARFDLSNSVSIPSSLPYGAVINRAGTRGWISLWNASEVAELDLSGGKVVRRIRVHAPTASIAAGSHPTAMLLSADEHVLYVALSNVDTIAVVDAPTGRVLRELDTKLPGQRYAGAYPDALALSNDGSRLFVADSSSDAVAVFDTAANKLLGFIPTEWYPTALAVRGDDLLIASGKGHGAGPNSGTLPPSDTFRPSGHPYIATMVRGSLARVNWREAERDLPNLTKQVLEANLMNGRTESFPFAGGRNPIKHVIYVIKENRTYDQIFGDIAGANGDPSLVMYGEQITPNEHKLARQFGVLDNFYDSGEVSGNGHAWSNAAIDSDYTERIWPIAYRGGERVYDFEGTVLGEIPLEQDLPDVNEPGTGYLWANVARHGLSHRNYGEFVVTVWCNDKPSDLPVGVPPIEGAKCAKQFIKPGEPLPTPGGATNPNPYQWPVPIIATDVATKPELRKHFDPHFADFNVSYPDQLRADEFLREFSAFVKERTGSHRDRMPAFILLRLPNDHTAGTSLDNPRPAASVADNDLALGRVVDALSHSPYWDDTAMFVLEDDAQDGADHVDAHRSIALVISKYSPIGSAQQPFVDHRFYTTVNVVRTMEALLGLPPMNNNDAQASLIAPLFSGPGNQPPFTADYRNRDNGLIYQANQRNAPGQQESAQMDFSHADAADAALLNQILWRDAKGDVPMPAPTHTVIPTVSH